LPLTEKGSRDAEDAREVIQSVPIKAAYISTSERRRSNRAIISGTSVFSWGQNERRIKPPAGC